jgi:metal-sulfur cluster biosynthetic enzyme
MPDINLKERLINKLKEINDPALLEEISNLFELQEPETIYQRTPQQKKEIEAAQVEIKNNQTFDATQADKEADEWLSE